MQKAKAFDISKQLVWQAYLKVKANRGAAGIDQVSLQDFEKDLKGNLYKIWNRMCSGSYMPSAVRLVEIPKGDGKTRPLGIPTVADRIAQMVIVMLLEPILEPHFYANSYGFRPGKSAHDAIEAAKLQCRLHRWVVDLDISKFFDTVDHELLMKALSKHIKTRWILLYIRRWLECPYQCNDGTLISRIGGVPQGSVIGPLLANLYLHYAFDKWMKINHADTPFERYADDIVCHCPDQITCENLLLSIAQRLQACKLTLNKEKSKIVYCKDSNRKAKWPIIQFDFLGHTFKPRAVKSKVGKYFTGFNPSISNKSKKRICEEIRRWKVNLWLPCSLKDIADYVNPIIRGWINYYGRFYPSIFFLHLRHIDLKLALWVRSKYKRFRRHKTASIHWLGKIARENPTLFAHWQLGYKPSAGIKVPVVR